jgi:hypothetical protein
MKKKVFGNEKVLHRHSADTSFLEEKTTNHREIRVINQVKPRRVFDRSEVAKFLIDG